MVLKPQMKKDTLVNYLADTANATYEEMAEVDAIRYRLVYPLVY